MDEQKDLPYDRIEKIMEFYGLNPNSFAKKIGLKRTQNLYDIRDGKIKKITFDLANKINTVFTVINKDWLITGNGDMLNINENNNQLDYIKKDIRIQNMQTIPVYDSVATLGIIEVFKGIETGNVLEYLSIPNLPKSDGAIFMTGDSMYPILKSGDIVALKIIHKSDIVYGEMHYLEYYSEFGDVEFKTIKYIKKSELGSDYIKLVSQNQHHDPKDILLSQVGTVAIVNASVRYNRL